MTPKELLEFLDECCESMKLEGDCSDECADCPFYNLMELTNMHFYGNAYHKQ
jgi:hypothetical protein